MTSFAETLKNCNLKNTKHRQSILEYLSFCTQPVSAEDIFLKLKSDNISINLSSVYRILDTFVEKDIAIKSNLTDSDTALFELNRHQHLHHFICKGCNKIFPIEGCPLADYEKVLEKKFNFSVTGHRLEIYGYCAECSKLMKNEK